MSTAAETVTISKREYEEFVRLQSEVAYLKQQLADVKRMIFGQKSERHIAGQSDANQTALELGLTANQQSLQTSTVETHTRTKKHIAQSNHPGRSPLPAHLRRVDITVEPQQDVTDMVVIDTEVTEELEYKEAELFVKRYIRHRYAPKNGAGAPVIAPLPYRPIEKGRPGPLLLAYLIVSKFVDHLPLYRLRRKFKRLGVVIAESTLSDWVIASAEALRPIHALIVEQIKASHYLQVDETQIRVLNSEKNKKGNNKLGYLWPCHAVEEKLACFYYYPSRNKQVANEILDGFAGLLQTDGYKGYTDVVQKAEITHLGCMAHARRYFEKALSNDRARAERALKYFRVLFAVESTTKDNREKRSLRRKRFSEPIMQSFKQWMYQQVEHTLPKSSLRKAINYSLNNWDALRMCLQHSEAQISNNLVENIIRPVAIGRKNYMFAGSARAAETIAMLYTIVASCKLNGVDPQTYIATVLEKIHGWKEKDLHQLLPVNFHATFKS